MQGRCKGDIGRYRGGALTLALGLALAPGPSPNPNPTPTPGLLLGLEGVLRVDLLLLEQHQAGGGDAAVALADQLGRGVEAVHQPAHLGLGLGLGLGVRR